MAVLRNPYEGISGDVLNSAMTSSNIELNKEEKIVKRNMHNRLFFDTAQSAAEARIADNAADISDMKTNLYRKNPWLIPLEVGLKMLAKLVLLLLLFVVL